MEINERSPGLRMKNPEKFTDGTDCSYAHQIICFIRTIFTGLFTGNLV